MGGRKAIACIVAAVAVAVALSGCSGSERDFEPVREAGWQPGYSYSYTVESQTIGSGSFSGDTSDETVPNKETGPEPLYSYTVFNTETTEDGTPLYLTLLEPGSRDALQLGGVNSQLSSISRNQPEVVAFRKTDLRPMYTRATAYSKDVQLSVTAYDEGYDWLRFPIERGASWSGEAQLPSGGGFGFGELTGEAAVGGLRSVEGPNGPTDAVHIRHSLFIPDKELLRKKILEDAREANVTVNSFDFDSYGSRDIYYAIDLHNIVLDTFTSHTMVAADFILEGKPQSIDVTVDQTVTVRLSAATLVAGPQRSLIDALTGKVGISLPPVNPSPGTSAPTTGSGPGSLRLTVDKPVVNAAETPEVSFTTQVTGSVTNLHYELADADGRAVASGTGGDFRLKAAEPGTYTATVTGNADGRTLRATAVLQADYLATVPADCPTISGSSIEECAGALVPVRAGAQSLTVTATRTPRASEPGSGTFVLMDASGKEISSAPLTNNVATITLPGPAPAGDWSVVYRPTYGILEQVAYTIDVRHSQP